MDKKLFDKPHNNTVDAALFIDAQPYAKFNFVNEAHLHFVV